MRLVLSDEVRADMACWVIVECPSCCDGSGVKPERQVISGAKSSVSGIGMGVHVGCVDFWMMDFKSCMSNSCGIVAVLWVAASPYFGEAKATML